MTTVYRMTEADIRTAIADYVQRMAPAGARVKQVRVTASPNYDRSDRPNGYAVSAECDVELGVASGGGGGGGVP